MLNRYNINDIQERAGSGGTVTSREVVALALHEMDIANRSHGYELAAHHVKRAEVYARIAQALKGS